MVKKARSIKKKQQQQKTTLKKEVTPNIKMAKCANTLQTIGLA